MGITVGCGGFAVPATRYFKDLLYVEVSETHVAMPGMSTVRRWRREASADFDFAALAPKDLSNGMAQGALPQAKAFDEVLRELRATTVVFSSPPLKEGRSERTAVTAFLSAARKRYERVVWEPPASWSCATADALAADVNVLATRDPLREGLSEASAAYYRLPGPAGYKSRYEDPMIEELAKLARKATHREVTYVFTNVDMFSDAKRFRSLLA